MRKLGTNTALREYAVAVRVGWVLRKFQSGGGFYLERLQCKRESTMLAMLDATTPIIKLQLEEVLENLTRVLMSARIDQLEEGQ
jgi:hypothetical protein